jgi:hypothetical protein
VPSSEPYPGLHPADISPGCGMARYLGGLLEDVEKTEDVQRL